jgi:hypothetical protein
LAVVETERAIRRAHCLVLVQTQRPIRRAHWPAVVETERAIRRAHCLVVVETERPIRRAHRLAVVETQLATGAYVSAIDTTRLVTHAYVTASRETFHATHTRWTATQETSAMITHVVLFRLKRGLPEDARDALAAALTGATREIPSIRRARVGARVSLGRAYEQLMTTDYSFAAILEFDDRSGLLAYLNHPAHAQLAQHFYASVEQALTYDFELWESDEGIEKIRRAL